MKTWQKLRNHPDLWERYFVREKVLTAIRRFFLDREFHEVETPYLTGSLPPESYLDIFETTLLDRQRRPKRAFLPTSPEPFLKKLLVAGIGNCFALPKSFRNTEDQSKTHNPEFTILEWYRVGASYTDIMADCEELLVFINTYLLRSKSNHGTTHATKLSYQGKTVDLSAPWQRLSMTEAFEKYARMDLTHALTRDAIARVAIQKGYAVRESDGWEELFDQMFLNEVEPKLGRGRPTILYDYPIALAALSKKKKSDPRFAERFEFYIEGLELGDGYSELTDWKEQLVRFHEEYEERKRLGKTDHPIDMDFIEALKAGMPPAGGIAVGVDRLIMLFSDVNDIADTLFFPGRELFEESDK
ncbi:EF-P lysine aminoacylase GenX [Candidatus Gottesmanbacteria bacterium]|nr:EF-P lysine aminoacylase GenX [Candidatus Gottesmanbacteria bacterium]